MSTQDKLILAGVLQQSYPILPDNIDLLKNRLDFWKVMLHKRQRNRNITTKNVLIDSSIIMGKEPLLSIYNILNNQKNSTNTSIIDFTPSTISTFYFDTFYLNYILTHIKPKLNYTTIISKTGYDTFYKSDTIQYKPLYRNNIYDPINTITIVENQKLFDLYKNYIFMYLYKDYRINIDNLSFTDNIEYKIIIDDCKLTVATNSYSTTKEVTNTVTNPDGSTSIEISTITVIEGINTETISLKVLNLDRYNQWQADKEKYQQDIQIWLDDVKQWIEDKKVWEDNPDNAGQPYPIPMPVPPPLVIDPTEDEYKYYTIPFPYTNLANLNDRFWINNAIITIVYTDIDNNTQTEIIPISWFDSFATTIKDYDGVTIEEEYTKLNLPLVQLLNWEESDDLILWILRLIGYKYNNDKQLNTINSINLGLPNINVSNFDNSSSAYSTTITFPAVLEYKTKQSIINYYMDLLDDGISFEWVWKALLEYLITREIQTNIYNSIYTTHLFGNIKDNEGNKLEPAFTNTLKAYKDTQKIKNVLKKVGIDYNILLFEKTKANLDDTDIFLENGFKSLKDNLRQQTKGMPTSGIDLNFIIPIFNDMPKSVQIALYTFFEQILLESNNLKQLPNTTLNLSLQNIELNYNTKNTNSILKINSINLEVQELKANNTNKIFSINTNIEYIDINTINIKIEYQKNANIKVILDIQGYQQKDIMKIFVTGNSNVSNQYHNVIDSTTLIDKLNSKNYSLFVPLTKEVILNMPFQYIPELSCYSCAISFSLISWDIQFGNTLAFEILSVIGKIFQAVAAIVVTFFTIYTAPIAFFIGLATNVGLQLGSQLLNVILKSVGVKDNFVYQIVNIIVSTTSVVVSALSGNYLITAIDTIELTTNIIELSTTIRLDKYEKELEEKQNNLNTQIESITNQFNSVLEKYDKSNKFNNQQVLDIVSTERVNPVFNMPFKDVYKVSTMLGTVYEPFYYTYEPIKNFVSNSLKL